MIKVFISQPMNGRTDKEIQAERNHIIANIKKDFGDDIEIIDSFIENAPDDATPLWYIGESLKLMSNADIVVFAKGWHSARGCKIEELCAKEYGYTRYYGYNSKNT